MTNLSKIDIRKTTIFETAVDLRIMKIGEKKSIISRDVFDFVIDGTDLTSLVRTDDGSIADLSSGLQSNFVTSEKIIYIERLLGKKPGDLDSGRVAILVCPECGDLQEGAVGCKIKFDMTMNTVTWYDFAWDFNDDEQDLSDEVRDKVQDLKSFTFDGEEYRALMKRILDSLNSDGVINL